MKKKVIIFRFGTCVPTQKEYGIIDQITGGTGRATGCGTPFGVISIVETSMKPAEIVQLFDKVAEDNGDCLPTIVLETSSAATAFNFDPHFFEVFDECNQEFDREFGTSPDKCTMSLDELLDLVNAKGLLGLSESELIRLKELSK
jgi:hypothetical protein